MKNLQEIQIEQKEWSETNFPNNELIDNILGVIEELGEFCHRYLKIRQGIRGTEEEHRIKMVDALGDIDIFLLGIHNFLNLDRLTVLNDIWNEVKKRNWVKNKIDGIVEVEKEDNIMARKKKPAGKPKGSGNKTTEHTNKYQDKTKKKPAKKK